MSPARIAYDQSYQESEFAWIILFGNTPYPVPYDPPA